MGIATQSAALAGAINWFEPPATDIGAAHAFYELALETYLSDGAGSAGVVSCTGDGTVYCAVPDIAAAMTLYTAAGGRALTEIIDLPAGIGRIAHMLDAAGHWIGLHQPGALA